MPDKANAAIPEDLREAWATAHGNIIAQIDTRWSSRFVKDLIERIADLTARAEREKRLAWQEITAENLPEAGCEVWRDLGEEQGGKGVEFVDEEMAAKWLLEDWTCEYWTHFRPLAAPEPRKEPQ